MPGPSTTPSAGRAAPTGATGLGRRHFGSSALRVGSCIGRLADELVGRGAGTLGPAQTFTRSSSPCCWPAFLCVLLLLGLARPWTPRRSPWSPPAKRGPDPCRRSLAVRPGRLPQRGAQLRQTAAPRTGAVAPWALERMGIRTLTQLNGALLAAYRAELMAREAWPRQAWPAVIRAARVSQMGRDLRRAPAR